MRAQPLLLPLSIMSILILTSIFLAGCTSPTNTTPKIITQAEFASHNSPTDCWIVTADGNVYTMTDILSRFPTYPLKNYCGKADANILIDTRTNPPVDVNVLPFDVNIKRPDLNRPQGALLPPGVQLPGHDSNNATQGTTNNLSQYFIGTLAK